MRAVLLKCWVGTSRLRIFACVAQRAIRAAIVTRKIAFFVVLLDLIISPSYLPCPAINSYSRLT